MAPFPLSQNVACQVHQTNSCANISCTAHGLAGKAEVIARMS